MPHARVPLPDVYESVTRKVIVDVTSQLARIMNLPEGTDVLFPGNEKSVPLNDGVFGNCCGAGVKYDPQERVVITYDEAVDDGYTLSTNVYNNQNAPIFHDELRQIRLAPIRRFVDVRIDIEYQAPGIVVVQRWIDDMRARISAGGAELTLDAQFGYQLPDKVWTLLKHLYDTMQASEFPIALEYPQWLEQNWKWATTELTTLYGTLPEVTIPEHQYNLIGWFDITSSPQPPQSASDNTGRYTAQLSYFFRYERPAELFCKYPMIVHQRPIDKLWRPTTPYYIYRDVLRKVSRMQEAFDMSFVLMNHGYIPWIQHPDTDDWTTDDIPTGRFTFFSGLLSLSCPDPQRLLDLTKMGRYKFRCYFLEYFSQVGQRAIGPTSLFEFRLYKNNEYSRIPLEIEPGTTIVRSTQPLDPQAVYHLQLSINTNFGQIDRKNWDCLRRYPTLVWTVAKLLNVGIGRKPLSELELLGAKGPRQPSETCPGEGTSEFTANCPTIDQGILLQRDIEQLVDEGTKDSNTGNLIGNRIGPLTVLFGEIIAERRE